MNLLTQTDANLGRFPGFRDLLLSPFDFCRFQFLGRKFLFCFECLAKFAINGSCRGIAKSSQVHEELKE